MLDDNLYATLFLHHLEAFIHLMLFCKAFVIQVEYVAADYILFDFFYVSRNILCETLQFVSVLHSHELQKSFVLVFLLCCLL